MHRGKIVVRSFFAMDDAEGNPGLAHLAAFLADVLAVLAVHGVEAVLERGPAGVVAPVVLDVLAQQPAVVLRVAVERRLVGVIVEVDVRRRQAVLPDEAGNRIEQPALRRLVSGQQPRAGHG